MDNFLYNNYLPCLCIYTCQPNLQFSKSCSKDVMDKIITIKICLPSMQSTSVSQRVPMCKRAPTPQFLQSLTTWMSTHTPVLAKFNYLNEHPPVSYEMVLTLKWLEWWETYIVVSPLTSFLTDQIFRLGQYKPVCCQHTEVLCRL